MLLASLLLLAQSASPEPSLLLTLAKAALESEAFWGVVALGLTALARSVWKDNTARRAEVFLHAVHTAYLLTNAIKDKTTTKVDDYAAVALGNFLKAMEAHGYKPTPKEEELAKLQLEAQWGKQVTAKQLAEEVVRAQAREMATIAAKAALSGATFQAIGKREGGEDSPTQPPGGN